jgi:hypothetical protein
LGRKWLSVAIMVNSVLFGAVLELLVNAIHFDLSKLILRSLLENQFSSTEISDSLKLLKNKSTRKS